VAGGGVSVRDRPPRRPDPFLGAPGAAFRRDREALVWIDPVRVPGRPGLKVVGFDESLPLPSWMDEAATR
jgi:hypothetical protein